MIQLTGYVIICVKFFVWSKIRFSRHVFLVMLNFSLHVIKKGKWMPDPAQEQCQENLTFYNQSPSETYLKWNKLSIKDFGAKLSDQIYNVNKSGLFWKALPSEILAA